jgi:ferrochelatase
MAVTGVLLINLGTPSEPDPESVGRYLKQFLMDKWVIDVPWLLRWFLVNVVIVPRRKHASSALYKTIWTQQGSPLLVHTKNLAARVTEAMGAQFPVAYAMRYGAPSIESGLRELFKKGVSEILVFPLYPQYAESTTRSSLEECEQIARRLESELGQKMRLRSVSPFYSHPEFLAANLAVHKETLSEKQFDHMLFTFHGLPERHIQRTDLTANHCLKNESCCAQVAKQNQDCYRAQCFATARALAQTLNLSRETWSVSFQSRLGRAEWIKPYTEDVIRNLASRGVKRLAVAAPSFTADCLETLEEIAVRGAEAFHDAGGEEFIAVPCVNSHPRWVQAVTTLIRENSIFQTGF